MKPASRRSRNTLAILGCSAATLASGVTTALALRQNYLEMLRLRQVVIDADTASDPSVWSHVDQLRRYVTTHMNTELPREAAGPRIQLATTYRIAVTAAEAEQGRRIELVNLNAREECERQFPSDRQLQQRAACVQQYIQANPVTVQTVSPDIYRFDFISPRWSPDLAGWLVVLTFLLGCGTLLLIAQRVWARRGNSNKNNTAQ